MERTTQVHTGDKKEQHFVFLGGAGIEVAAKIWDVQIHVHHPGHTIVEFGKGSQRIDLMYGGDSGTTTGTHYDVLTSETKEQTAKSDDEQEAKRQTKDETEGTKRKEPV